MIYHCSVIQSPRHMQSLNLLRNMSNIEMIFASGDGRSVLHNINSIFNSILRFLCSYGAKHITKRICCLQSTPITTLKDKRSPEIRVPGRLPQLLCQWQVVGGYSQIPTCQILDVWSMFYILKSYFQLFYFWTGRNLKNTLVIIGTHIRR